MRGPLPEARRAPGRDRVHVPAVGGWEAREQAAQAAAVPSRVAPWLTGDCSPRWEGRDARKPWEHRVTVMVPHLETPELLPLGLALLRAQTAEPYLVVVDTGSSWETCRWLEEEVRAADTEIHFVRGHAYRHPSEPVCLALDLTLARCLTEFLFLTHSDVFLKRREFLAELLAQCSADCPVVGYEMSPRDGSDGKTAFLTADAAGMVGHTAAMLHVPTLRRIGANWTMERAFEEFGVAPNHWGWPDTETVFGYCLRAAGIEPLLIGKETNFERYDDANLTHCRSYSGSKLHAGEYHEGARAWVVAALDEARARLREWGAE